MRWTMRGVKPTREARVRTASSSAVLREFTIQSWSAYVRQVGRPARRRPVAGTPSPHGTSHSGQRHDVVAEGGGARL